MDPEELNQEEQAQQQEQQLGQGLLGQDVPAQHAGVQQSAYAQQAPPQQPRQPQQPPGPPPEAVLPWGTADSIELQRHMAGLSQVEKDVAAGVLSPEEGQQATGLLLPRLGGLLQKQQKFQQQQKQQGIQGAMEQSALTESIRGLHLEQAANAFTRTLAHVIHPFTGRDEMFYPQMDAHGSVSWKPVEFKDSHADDDFLVSTQPGSEEGDEGAGAEGVEGAGQAGGPAAGGQIQPANFEQPGQTVADLNEQSAASKQPMPLQQLGSAMRGSTDAGRASVDPNTFEQTVISGNNVTKYRGGQQVSTTRPPRAEPQGVVSEAELKGMHEMARRAMGPLKHDATPAERLHYEDRADKLVHAMLQRKLIAHEFRLRAQETQQKVKMQRELDAQEHQRQEASRVREHERQEASREKDRSEVRQQRQEADARAEYTSAREHLQKRYERAARDINNQDDKGNLDVSKLEKLDKNLLPENHHKAAVSMAQLALKAGRELTGRKDEGGGPKTDELPSDQGKKVVEEVHKDLGGAAGGNRQASQEGESRPSKIDHGQVRNLLEVARRTLAAAHNPGRDSKPLEGKPMEDLRAMHDLLVAADQGKRPLSSGEALKYDRAWNAFSDTMRKETKGKWDAGGLRIDQGTQAGRQSEALAVTPEEKDTANTRHQHWIEGVQAAMRKLGASEDEQANAASAHAAFRAARRFGEVGVFHNGGRAEKERRKGQYAELTDLHAGQLEKVRKWAKEHGLGESPRTYLE